MLQRNLFLLFTIVLGGMCVIVGTPQPYRYLTAGAVLFLLAYIYAQLTKPTRRP